MQEKIAVIVCGNSGIDYIKHGKKIDVFRSMLYVDEDEYEDYVDIEADAFYQRLLDNPNTNVKTSQTSTGKMGTVYKQLESEGYTDVIVITISSFLSGTYQNALLAADTVKKLKVHVFDSKSVSYPEARMALDAFKMAKEKKSVADILSHLEYIRDNSRIYFSVGTLKYLVKNGRLSGAAGFIGNLLKIKPTLWISPEGKVEVIEKIRTSSKAMNKLKQRYFEETKDIKIEPFIIYTINYEEAVEIANEIKQQYPYINEVPIYPLTPVVGAHAGPGAIGLGYIKIK